MKVEITLDGPEPTVKRILHAAFEEVKRISDEEYRDRESIRATFLRRHYRVPSLSLYP